MLTVFSTNEFYYYFFLFTIDIIFNFSNIFHHFTLLVFLENCGNGRIKYARRNFRSGKFVSANIIETYDLLNQFSLSPKTILLLPARCYRSELPNHRCSFYFCAPFSTLLSFQGFLYPFFANSLESFLEFSDSVVIIMVPSFSPYVDHFNLALFTFLPIIVLFVCVHSYWGWLIRTLSCFLETVAIIPLLYVSKM